MYFLIIFIPLLNFFNLSLFGRLLGRKGSIHFVIYWMLLAFLISLIIFYEIIFSHTIVYIKWGTWFSINNYNITFNLYYDSLTASMILIIILISTIVHIYSTEYMAEDPHIVRFLAYLSLFTFFMLCLITSSGFLQLFLGWEGVGLCSFLLINFWYTRFQANKSSLKALIINKISDCFLLGAIVLSIYYFNTDNFIILFNLITFIPSITIPVINYNITIINLIATLIFIGAVGKSAQLILHVWLPDAMEGPTPVSALIHAATMVTAGIFILLRCNLFLTLSSITDLIVIFGALTAFFSAIIGLFQYDIKKIIAYSTCSQLGYMMFACGLMQYNLSLFHLVNHAFFKALLFLTAGSIIHSLHNLQDLRLMGNLLKKLPLAYIFFFIGALTLSGFPFLTGYYSKDFLIEICLGNYTVKYTLSFFLGYITAWLTLFYSIRSIYYVFYSKIVRVHSKLFWNNIYEMSKITAICLLLLSLFSICFGYFFKDIYLKEAATFIFYNVIYNPYNFSDLTYEYTNKYILFFIQYIPAVIIMFLFVLFMYINKMFYNMYYKILLRSSLYFKINTFILNKWFFDGIYNTFIAKCIIKTISLNLTKNIDKGLLEFFGPYWITIVYKKIMHKFNFFQQGFTFKYLSFYINCTFLITIIYVYFLGKI